MELHYSNFVPFVLIPFIGWGVRHHLMRAGEWLPLKKATFAVGISAYFLTETARSFYRPYIYANRINDYHIADTLGNSFGTVTAIFMLLTMIRSDRMKPHQIILMTFFGLIAYEVLSASESHRIDVWDLGTTVVFTLLSTALYYGILIPKTHRQVQKSDEIAQTFQ